MRRRDFIKVVIASAATWPFAANAQQSAGKVSRIGFVGSATADGMAERLVALRAGLRNLGYQEGQNIIIEYRWADEHYERLPALFAEMVRLNVDVIVTGGTPGALAAKRTTTKIPVIFAVVGDAIASGIVSSLGKPEGNITGLTYFNPELSAKRLELLRETMPTLTDVGVLTNPENPFNETIIPAMELTAQTLKLTLHQFGARRVAELEEAFAAMVTKRMGAFVVLDDPILVTNPSAVAKLALQQHLPSSGSPEYAIAGGLMAYGVNIPDMYRRAATFVDKILKGAKPADVPVERATKFELIINLKTAKALNFTVSSTLLARADEVIE